MRTKISIGIVTILTLFFLGLFGGLPGANALETQCTDKVDNDADGYTDCLDADCAPTVAACYSCCMAHSTAAALAAESEKAKQACLVLCKNSDNQ